MDANEQMKRIKQEYQEFATIERSAVPLALSENILSQVWADLNPSVISVFMKMTMIHFLVGLATLALCPQFGISLTSSMGLMHYLMRFGESVCMLGCGAFFTGSSLLVASLALRPEEVRVLSRTRVLQIVSLATLSLGALIGVGAEVVVSFGLVWVLGAVLGGTGFLQLGWTIRKAAIQGAL